ncbi:MAG: hypothetical protein HY901_02390, partial [Deltaproteobacteria bacterium]|nr:hypothetical protein [Deltaproteobacteria bacterium]
MTTAPALTTSNDAQLLEREAATILANALALAATLHLPGARESHRGMLERAIELAHGALALDNAGLDPATIAGARSTLVKAYAARAEDARHGAGQLMQCAQRAPTREDCDDGWQRVEEVVAVAEASACHAARVADEFGDRAAWVAARKAAAAAREARQVVDER